MSQNIYCIYSEKTQRITIIFITHFRGNYYKNIFNIDEVNLNKKTKYEIQLAHILACLKKILHNIFSFKYFFF